VITLNGLSEPELLGAAAAAERSSEHPLGRAVLRAAVERGISIAEMTEFEAIPGLGVRATRDGHTVQVGRATELGDRVWTEQIVARIGEAGTVIGVTVDDEPAGLLVLTDGLRPDARSAIARLKTLGVDVGLVSGDQQAAADRIAAQVGIETVHAGVFPQDKAAIVRALQAQGHRVAFVGDGINDGPALAVADVGIAMGLSGTDLALQTAQIALLADELETIPHLLVLTIAVALTIIGILRPVSGALLHELSSIPVIANSARLIKLRT
jgi:Cd2+/Zn2+-exporting ATPase